MALGPMCVPTTEPKRAIRPRAGVDLVEACEELGQVGRVGVHHGEAFDAAFLLLDVLQDGGQSLLARAHPAGGGDLAFLEGDEGLDVEQPADEGLGPADAPSAPQVLQGVGGGEDAAALAGGPGDGFDLVDGGSRGGRLGGADDGQAQGGGDEAAVHDPDGDAGGVLLGGEGGRLQGGADLRGDADHQDAVGAAGDQSGEGLLKPAHGGGGRLGEHPAGGEAAPELVAAQFLAVDQFLLTEADGEGDHFDSVLGDDVVGQVAGGIGDDADHFSVRVRVGQTIPRREGAAPRLQAVRARTARSRVTVRKPSEA